MALEISGCPECGLAAEVARRDWLDSTAGPVEHVHIRCVQRHWFLMPAEGIASMRAGSSSGSRRLRKRSGTPTSK